MSYDFFDEASDACSGRSRGSSWVTWTHSKSTPVAFLWGLLNDSVSQGTQVAFLLRKCPFLQPTLYDFSIFFAFWDHEINVKVSVFLKGKEGTGNVLFLVWCDPLVQVRHGSGSGRLANGEWRWFYGAIEPNWPPACKSASDFWHSPKPFAKQEIKICSSVFVSFALLQTFTSDAYDFSEALVVDLRSTEPAAVLATSDGSWGERAKPAESFSVATRSLRPSSTGPTNPTRPGKSNQPSKSAELPAVLWSPIQPTTNDVLAAKHPATTTAARGLEESDSFTIQFLDNSWIWVCKFAVLFGAMWFALA